LNQGELSEVVKTEFGYHIIKLEDIQLASVRSLDETRPEIVKILQLDQAKPLTLQLANSAYEAIISAGSLAAFLDAQPDTSVVETELFSRSSAPPGMTAEPEFLDKAFGLKEGELSSLIETNDGYVIISATAIKEPQVPELSSVRAEAEADYRFEKASEQAASIANQLLDDLRSTEDGSYQDVVQGQQLTAEASGPLTKSSGDYQSSFPQSLVQSAFRLSAADPVAAEPGLFGTDYYVYWFNDRKPPETSMSAEDHERYKDMLQQFKEQQILDGWLAKQQAEAKISIHGSLQNF